MIVEELELVIHPQKQNVVIAKDEVILLLSHFIGVMNARVLLKIFRVTAF